MIDAKAIKKSYRKQQTLSGIDFHLEAGQVLGILGPNGAGKTTLLKILSLVMKPDAGRLEIAGRDALKNPEEVLPIIGYVPQETALFEDLTVRDNMMCWCRLKGKALRDKCDSVARTMQVDTFYRKRVRALSGGMKRRVNLAIALLNDPMILIMDEPLVGVDIKARRSILHALRGMAQSGMAIIITSHHGEEILQIADSVMLLSGGLVAFYGNTKEFEALQPQGVPLDDKILSILSN